MGAPEPIWRGLTTEADLRADLERARGIAVALEQECADLRRQVDELTTTVTGLSGMVLVGRLAQPRGPVVVHHPADQGDVVGQEGLPLGDPWAESPIPEDWREEE